MRLIADEWWIEWFERELEPNLRRDLSALLRGSRPDRDAVLKLLEARQFAKASDDVALPEDGRYYDCLLDKVMAALEADRVADVCLSEEAPSLKAVERTIRPSAK